MYIVIVLVDIIQNNSVVIGLVFTLTKLQFSDPGLVVYIYESIPGYGINALRFLAWMYFTYATFMNLKNYREKIKFYVPFYVLFCLW